MIPKSKISPPIIETDFVKTISFFDEYVNHVFTDIYSCIFQTDFYNSTYTKMLTLRVENPVESFGIIVFELHEQSKGRDKYLFLVFLWSEDRIIREKKAGIFSTEKLLEGKYYSSSRILFISQEEYEKKYRFLHEAASRVFQRYEINENTRADPRLKNSIVVAESFSDTGFMSKTIFLADEKDFELDSQLSQLTEEIDHLYESGDKLSEFNIKFLFRYSIFDIYKAYEGS